MQKLNKIDPYTYQIPRSGSMKVPVTLFLSERLKDEVEEAALQQIMDAASIDSDSFVFATPDIHTGYGVPIGSVLASPHYISPSAVGYDINCGMRLLATPFTAGEVDVRSIASGIAGRIPLGEGKENLVLSGKELRLVLGKGLDSLESVLSRFGLLKSPEDFELLADDRIRSEDGGRLPGSEKAVPEDAKNRGRAQMGTLGGGNHFIEIQELVTLEERPEAEALGLFRGQLLIMIHSGSRRLGYEVAGLYMRKAKDYMMSRGIEPPNSQLLFFPADSKEGEDYLGAMNAAANYAYANREVMALLVRCAVASVMGKDSASEIRSIYDVTHNMAKKEKYGKKNYFVHRKGATRAFDGKRMRGSPYRETGQPVLIPGSMGTASYILLGHPGSERSFYSVNHGAGRRMSRSQAAGKRKGKKRRPGLITDAAFEKSMEGIHLICGNRRRIKEEAPAAYKDIDEVIKVVTGAGLALQLARLRPLAVLKG